jgi:hypothetical protein
MFTRVLIGIEMGAISFEAVNARPRRSEPVDSTETRGHPGRWQQTLANAQEASLSRV